MFVKTNTKHLHVHIPKGSYHHHCRKRFQQFQTRLSQTKRATKSVRSQRVTLSRNQNLNNFNNFQDYISLLQKSVNIMEQDKFRVTTRKIKNNTAQHTHRQRKIQGEKQKGKEKLGVKNQIIDSHLPFFKCKLQNKQTISRKPDFKIKDSKFTVNLNIIESNFKKKYEYY